MEFINEIVHAGPENKPVGTVKMYLCFDEKETTRTLFTYLNMNRDGRCYNILECKEFAKELLDDIDAKALVENFNISMDKSAASIIIESVLPTTTFDEDDIKKISILHENWKRTGKLTSDWGKVCKPIPMTIKDSIHSKGRKIGRGISFRAMNIWLRSTLVMFDQGFNEKEQNYVRLYMSPEGTIVAAVKSKDDTIGTTVTTWTRPYRNGYEVFVKEVLKWYELKKSGKPLPNSLLRS
jgi:hypothetical protein